MKRAIESRVYRIVIIVAAFGIGFLCGRESVKIPPIKKLSITEQMKAIQRQVGCKKIDGEIGSETTPLVNAKVRAEKKREQCNQGYYKSLELMEIKK